MGKIKDLRGQRFGKLIALEPTKERRGGSVVWKCQCDCGEIAYVASTCLSSGLTKSCGCLLRKDITNQRFGRLIALYPLKPKEPGKIYWHCKCDCGNEIDVILGSLTSGNTKSCGCLHRDSLMKDLTNQKFGKLTAIYPIGTTKTGQVIWHCQCDCGGTKDVPAHRLKNGNTQSCGCLNRVDLTGQRFGKLTVLKFVTTKSENSIWLCQCDCGNLKEVSNSSLVSGGTKSCGCLSKSYNNYFIKNLLQDQKIKFISEYKKFKSPITNRFLPFDFYLIDFNKIIEYDGIQHFKNNDYFGGIKAFQDRQRNDKLKNQWCIDNNIQILRIPWYKEKDITLEMLLNEITTDFDQYYKEAEEHL